VWEFEFADVRFIIRESFSKFLWPPVPRPNTRRDRVNENIVHLVFCWRNGRRHLYTTMFHSSSSRLAGYPWSMTVVKSGLIA
jgi:hypothetical protein